MSRTFTVKLNIRFTIEADETSISTGEDQDAQTYHARQRRLFQAILSNDERLLPYLKFLVSADVSARNWQRWYEILLGKNEDVALLTALTPAIESLDKPDQEFFMEALQNGVLYENIEAMEKCFDANLETAEIVVKED